MDPQNDFRTARVLIVEDAPDVLLVLTRSLSENGYEVLTAQDGEAALRIALDEQPDLVILDIGLPRKDGYEVARDLRSRAFTAPVLMLTARDAISDKVEGLDAGADDYLAKPFNYDELMARVRALLRRSALLAGRAMIRIGDLEIDPLTRDVHRGTREVNLTQKEYALLEYLARHAGHPLSREQISQHVWKQPFDPGTNIVDVYINYVRKKVDVPGEPSVVQTVRGVGYMLRADQSLTPP
jgi:DNA-binding response OmpR family regulator